MINAQAKEALREKAVKVYRYVIRGVRVPDIAQLENLPRRTVYWLVEEGGRILGGELKFLAKKGLLRDLFFNYQERRREYWFNYSSAKSIKDKLNCLGQIREEDRFALNLAERLGFIEQKTSIFEGKMTLAELMQLAEASRHKNRL